MLEESEENEESEESEEVRAHPRFAILAIRDGDCDIEPAKRVVVVAEGEKANARRPSPSSAASSPPNPPLAGGPSKGCEGSRPPSAPPLILLWVGVGRQAPQALCPPGTSAPRGAAATGNGTVAGNFNFTRAVLTSGDGY